jgi:hypothetical protein
LPPERGPPSDEEDLKEDRSEDDDAPTDVPLKTAYPSRLPERPSNIRLPGGPTSKANISGPKSPQKSPQKSPVKVVKKSSAIAATSSEEIETKGTTRQNGGTVVTSPRKSPAKKAKSEDNKEARKGKREARGDPPEDNEDKQE